VAWWRRGGSEPAAPRADPVAKQQVSAPVQRAAWRDVPPLQPVLTATRPVAPLDTFTGSLATARNPSFLAPLGHIVDPAGPSGQVDGLASPVTPTASLGGPELLIARPPSAVSQAVQRIRLPQRWMSADPSDAPSVQRLASAGVADSTPAPSAAKELRSLPIAAPAYRYELTSAPDPGVQHPLPVVSANTAPLSSAMTTGSSAGLPTVSRQIVDEATSHRTEPLQRDVAEPAAAEQSTPMPINADSTNLPSAGTGQASGAEAPLLGTAGLTSQPPSTAGAASSADDSVTAMKNPVREVPGNLAPPAGSGSSSQTLGDAVSAAPPPGGTVSSVQRLAGPTSRSPGLGAPLSSVPRAARPAIQRAPTGSAIGSPMVQQTAVQRALPTMALKPAPPGGAAPSTGGAATTQASLVDTSPVHLHVAVDNANPAEAGVPGLTAVMRILDTGEPASADHQVAGTRVVDAAPLVPPGQPHRPVGLGAPIPMSNRSLPPVQRQVASVAQPSTAGPSFGAAIGRHVQPASGSSPADQTHTELLVPAVQRSATNVGSHPPGSDHDGTAQPDPDDAQATTAPLLGGFDLGAATSTSRHQPPGEKTTAATVPVTPPAASAALTAVQRSSLSPIPGTGERTDRVSAREVSFEQMFAPGAAAIASGAAYADSPNSVVFHPPPTVTPETTATLGAASIPAVQRFGLPSVSSLVKQGREAAGGYADSARQSVSGLAGRAQQEAGGYADTARQAAGGYLNQARSTAGGYLDQARSTAGGYADMARGTAGGYADKARETAGGYADKAREVGGGYADQALGYADTAMGTARGFADQAGDTASGLLDNARGMASTAADRATGAVTDAGSAAGKAVGGAVDAAGDAVSGATAAAGDAASGAAAAVTGAAAGVAGAAAGAAGALPTDLNELARRLFDPLNDRFKTELWLDRERAGMVTDLRR